MLFLCLVVEDVLEVAIVLVSVQLGERLLRVLLLFVYVIRIRVHVAIFASRFWSVDGRLVVLERGLLLITALRTCNGAPGNEGGNNEAPKLKKQAGFLSFLRRWENDTSIGCCVPSLRFS